MTSLSTHVLDAVAGEPARGLGVTLSVRDGSGRWTDVTSGTTDDDGRVASLAEGGLDPGVHRLTFDVGAWFDATGRRGFYPEVAVTFTVERDRHHHVPLLLSPFAYSTYRGS